MSEPTRFYVILREDDGRLHRHGSLAEASAEALRLADRHPGKKFIILKGKYEVRRKLDPPLVPMNFCDTHGQAFPMGENCPAEIQNVHRFNEGGEY